MLVYRRVLTFRDELLFTDFCFFVSLSLFVIFIVRISLASNTNKYAIDNIKAIDKTVMKYIVWPRSLGVFGLSRLEVIQAAPIAKKRKKGNMNLTL